MRKYDAIDIVKVTVGEWNIFLTKALSNQNVIGLTRAMYGVQAGMDDLAKKFQNTAENIRKFQRLQKSIENTLKQILRIKYPSPMDNPRKIYIIGDKEKHLTAKRKRDTEFEIFLRKSSY